VGENKKSKLDENFQIKIRLIRISFSIGIVIAMKVFQSKSG